MQWAGEGAVRLRILCRCIFSSFSCLGFFSCHTCWCWKRKWAALLNHSCLICGIRRHLPFHKCLWPEQPGIPLTGLEFWLVTFVPLPWGWIHLEKPKNSCFLTQKHSSYLSLTGLLCHYFKKPWTTMYPSSWLSLLGIYGTFWLGTQVAFIIWKWFYLLWGGSPLTTEHQKTAIYPGWKSLPRLRVTMLSYSLSFPVSRCETISAFLPCGFIAQESRIKSPGKEVA